MQGSTSGAAPPAAGRTAGRWRTAPFLALLLLAALYNGTGMVQAVDTWIGLAAGRHIAAHGVDDADPFAFSSRRPADDRPAASPAVAESASSAWWPRGWINQKWLVHLASFRLHRAFGPDALVAARFVAYLALAALLLAGARVHGAGTASASLAAALALVATRPFADFRAQDVTLVLTAVLLLLLALSVRRTPRALWAVVPLLALWCNVHGGFIYAFVALLAYVAGAAFTAWRRMPWCALGAGGVRTALAVTAAAAVAAVLASPFRLANLTHPLKITVGPDASLWRRVNEWLPALTPGARLPEVVPFFLLLAATGALLAVALWPPATASRGARGPRPVAGGPVLPALDAGGALLAALTVAMALRSMRFVPLAAIAVTPVLAWAIAAVAARLHRALGSAAVRLHAVAGHAGPWAAAALGAAAAVALAVRWDRSYSRPWPFTVRPVTVLERMTAGQRRGPELGEFLRRNRVEGRTFNFWEEGGFLAWTQAPPEDGRRLPVQLLIDGRAQEAFPSEIVPAYVELGVGGPAGVRAASERRLPRPDELRAMGEWVDARLKADGMWLAFLPQERWHEGIARALFSRVNWRLVYLDEWHAVLVDLGDARGRALDRAVADDAAALPDDQPRLLTRAARSAESTDAAVRRAGLAAAERAFALRPSAAAAASVLRLDSPELHGEVTAFAARVVAEVCGSETRWINEAGFVERAGAAIAAATFLADDARRRGASSESERLAELARRTAAARDRIVRRTLWWG